MSKTPNIKITETEYQFQFDGVTKASIDDAGQFSGKTMESYAFIPTADVQPSGDITDVTGRVITTTTDLTGIDLTGKVISLADGTTEFCLIASNTDTTITVDCDFVNVVDTTWTWQVIQTYHITSNNPQIVALYLNDGVGAVVLPEVTTANDRNVIKVYIEVKNGNRATVVAREDNKITSQFFNKWKCLESQNEMVEFLPHNTAAPHFDIVNEQFAQHIATAYYDDDYETVATTDAQRIVSAAKVTDEFERRFELRTDGDGFYYWVFTSLIPTFIRLEAKVSIERSGGAASTVDGYWTKNDVALNRLTTALFTGGETDTILIIDVAELTYGDKIYPMVQRASATGTYTILEGGSIIINKL